MSFPAPLVGNHEVRSTQRSAFKEHLSDLQVVPQHDKVRTGAEPDPPDVPAAEQDGRTLAHRGEDVAERHASVGDAANPVQKLGSRAGNCPVRAPDDTVLGDHAHLAQNKLPVTETRGSGGVAHQGPAARCRGQHHAEHVVGEVDLVGDDLDCHPRVCQSRPRQSGRGPRSVASR